MTSIFSPKIPKPKPPAPIPTPANVEAIDDNKRPSVNYSSLIATSPVGLKKKATTSKRSLLGGS